MTPRQITGTVRAFTFVLGGITASLVFNGAYWLAACLFSAFAIGIAVVWRMEERIK